MTEPVTVLMPVGPNYNPEWLQEAVGSVLEQTYSDINLYIVDDGAHIPEDTLLPDSWVGPSGSEYFRYWYQDIGMTVYPPRQVKMFKSPVNLGFSAAFNLGMGLLNNYLVMFLASDDKMMPNAVERAVATWEEHDRKDAWYPCKYIDSNGHICAIPNNLALTTKHFFLGMCGGYPPAAFVGPDAALLSCLMVHAPDRIIPVESEEPLYWIRDHDQQETKIHTWKYVEEMNSIRGKLTAEFKLNV